MLRQYCASVFSEAWRITPDRGRGFAEAVRRFHEPNAPLAWVIHLLPKSNVCKMAIGDDLLQG